MSYREFRKIEGAEISGLEGPFRYVTGIILYYDPREGQYYNAAQDMYVSNEEMEYHFGRREKDWNPLSTN